MLNRPSRRVKRKLNVVHGWNEIIGMRSFEFERSNVESLNDSQHANYFSLNNIDTLPYY